MDDDRSRGSLSKKRDSKEKEKRKHTVGLEPTISCSVGKRLIQLGYACLFASFLLSISQLCLRFDVASSFSYYF